MTKKATENTTESMVNDFQATLVESVQKFAELNAQNVQRVAAMQMGAMQSCLESAMGNFKAFAAVKDVQELPTVITAQVHAIQAAGQKSAAEMAEMVRVNVAYGQEMQVLAQSLAAKVMPKAG